MSSSTSSIAVPTSSDSTNTLAGEIIRPIGARTALNRQKAVAQQLPEEKVATNGEKLATNQGQSGTRRQALNARMSSTTGMRNWGFEFWKSVFVKWYCSNVTFIWLRKILISIVLFFSQRCFHLSLCDQYCVTGSRWLVWPKKMVGRTNNHAGNQGDEERPSSNETMPYFLTHLLMVGTKDNIFIFFTSISLF